MEEKQSKTPYFSDEEIYKISQEDFNKELWTAKNKALKFLDEFYQEYNEKLSCADLKMTPSFPEGVDNITIKASELIEAFIRYTNKDKDYTEILDRLLGYKYTSNSLLKKLISGFTRLNYKRIGKPIYINIHISQMKLICMILEYQYMALLIHIIHRFQQASNAKNRNGSKTESVGLVYKINRFIKEEMIGIQEGDVTDRNYIEYSSLSLSKPPESGNTIKKIKVEGSPLPSITKDSKEVDKPQVTTNKEGSCIKVTAIIPPEFFGKKIIITVQ